MFMAQQNGRGRTRIHCLEMDHSTSECVLAPAPHLGRQPQHQRDYVAEERGYHRNERSEKILLMQARMQGGFGRTPLFGHLA